MEETVRVAALSTRIAHSLSPKMILLISLKEVTFYILLILVLVLNNMEFVIL